MSVLMSEGLQHEVSSCRSSRVIISRPRLADGPSHSFIAIKMAVMMMSRYEQPGPASLRRGLRWVGTTVTGQS